MGVLKFFQRLLKFFLYYTSFWLPMRVSFFQTNPPLQGVGWQLVDGIDFAIDALFWVDIAVVNQHANATRGFDWWSGTFREAVKRIGLTLLVLAPRRKAVTLERAWCIREVRRFDCVTETCPGQQA